MIGYYETDFGPVKVSEAEGRTLQLFCELQRHPIGGVAEERFLRKARLLIADCEKVARFKTEHA